MTRIVAPRPGPGRGRVVLVRPPPADQGSYVASATGSYRVADSSLVGYLLYRGVDGSPNLAGAAWETFTSLPHLTASLAPSHVYRFVLRQRNAYGLISQNVAEWVISIDGSGNQDPIRPSDPDSQSLTPWSAGSVRLTARYDYDTDGANQADAWIIYLRSNGTDPVPGVDSAIEVAMIKADGVAKLDWTSPAYNEGADVRVIVRTRRNGTPDVDSAGVNVLQATATLLGPAAPEAELFFQDGPALEQ